MPPPSRPTVSVRYIVSLEVNDLDDRVALLRVAGTSFRNEIVGGVGGRQILLNDPSGNPIELFEPYAD